MSASVSPPITPTRRRRTRTLNVERIGSLPPAAGESAEHLGQYNAEAVSSRAMSKVYRRELRELRRASASCALGRLPEVLTEVLLPQLAFADVVASRYQALHRWTGVVQYLLAALAVSAGACGALLAEGRHWLAVVEALLVASILALFLAAHAGQWHRKWVDYRCLAERIRAAMYLTLARMDCSSCEPQPHDRLGDTWMVGAFEWIRHRLRAWPDACPEPPAPVSDEALKLLRTAWIGGQERFYSKRARRFRCWHAFLGLTAAVLFVATLCAVAARAFGLDRSLLPAPDTARRQLEFLAIVLPAFAASLGAVRLHSEFERSAKRYEQMELHLEAVGQALERPGRSDAERRALIDEADLMMMRENGDWRALFLLHPPELSA
jgi:hypothetical protein